MFSIGTDRLVRTLRVVCPLLSLELLAVDQVHSQAATLLQPEY